MAITFSDISGAQRWVGLGQARLIPSLQVIYDSTITGFRPVTPDDLGDAVSITGNVSIDDFISLTGITNVTGVVSFKENSQVGITGFPLNATGVVSFKENSQVGITGFPLNITGVVSFKNDSVIGITGFPLNVTGIISIKANSYISTTGLPITGQILLNNVTDNTLSSSVAIENYNQNIIFYEITGASVSLSGFVQTQAPTNNWINLDSRIFSVAGNTVLSVEGPYSNIRVLCSGYISGGMTASLQSRKI